MKLSKEEVAALVEQKLINIMVHGVTFHTEPSTIHRQDAHWRVGVMPSQEPDRLFATYEELAILETELHEQGHLEIILYLEEPALVHAA